MQVNTVAILLLVATLFIVALVLLPDARRGVTVWEYFNGELNHMYTRREGG